MFVLLGGDSVNFVEPLRDPALVEDVANYLKNKNPRNYIMFILGIYTGLRISDILKLKIRDVQNKKYINIREKKTGKQKALEINPTLKKALNNYCQDKDPDDYLIKSRVNYNKPIHRSTAYKILNEAAQQFNIEAFGTHTLRKTFGYHFYKQTKDVVILQEIFNHSHPSVTLRYIGIKQETANEAIRKFKIY